VHARGMVTFFIPFRTSRICLTSVTSGKEGLLLDRAAVPVLLVFSQPVKKPFMKYSPLQLYLWYEGMKPDLKELLYLTQSISAGDA